MNPNPNPAPRPEVLESFCVEKITKAEGFRITLYGEGVLVSGNGATVKRKLVCYVEHILPEDAPVPPCTIAQPLPVFSLRKP